MNVPCFQIGPDVSSSHIPAEFRQILLPCRDIVMKPAGSSSPGGLRSFGFPDFPSPMTIFAVVLPSAERETPPRCSGLKPAGRRRDFFLLADRRAGIVPRPVSRFFASEAAPKE